MSEATALRMGKLVTSAMVLIISKLFVILRLQPGRNRALTKQEVTPAEIWFHGELQRPRQRRWQTTTSEEEDTKEAAEAESVCSDDEKLGPIRSNNYIWWRERETG